MKSTMFLLVILLTNINVISNAKYKFADIAIEERAIQEKEPFKDFLNRFILDFNSKNAEEINKYIYSNYGFFVLDNPGAFTAVEHFNSFDEIMILESEYNIGFLKVAEINCEFIKGEIPYYYCDDPNHEQGWSKEGCFYNKDQKLSLTEYYRVILEYGLGEEYELENDIKMAEEVEKYITHLAYCTDCEIGFYFGIINENWYLICIDKVTQCDA